MPNYDSRSKLLCLPHKSFLALVLYFSITSCNKEKNTHITVNSSRELTTEEKFQNIQKKEPLKKLLNNTSDPYKFSLPELWEEQKPTQFRILNFTFGDKGEVYLSKSRGGILPNINRWLGQFKQPPLANTSALETINVFNHTTFIVETTGSFQGMRMPKPIKNFALLGALVEVNGSLITIKMTGTINEVKSQKLNFLSFCKSLQNK